MKIKFLGAAGTVTGSSYVLTSDSGNSILIDLGMFQGTPSIEQLNYEPFDYNPSQLSGAILTHAHLDHCGRLPIILPKGFKEKIYMTPATRDLTKLTLLDSAKVAIQDGKQILYDADLANATLERFKAVEYHTPFTISDFTITFYDAGHILGSASVVIEDIEATSEFKTIVFSGDLGNTPEELVKPTEHIYKADAVVMESTYGDKLHPDLEPSDLLASEINAVEATGGTLLIPAFALERTQELLHMLKFIKKKGKIKTQTPIFLDSPMAQKATEIYVEYQDLFNDQIQQELKMENLFDFPGLHVTEKRKDREFLHECKDAKVIIAGSGMMTGGRIVSHAAKYLLDAKNRLFIVGYQGEGTLGRELMEGKKQVLIDGEIVEVEATVTSTQSMSSHADQSQLLDWLKAIRNVKKVFLTHGEDGPRSALAQVIREKLSVKEVLQPQQNQEISLC